MSLPLLSDARRFWAKVHIPDLFSCWEWQAARTPCGYGVFQMRGTLVYAHRFSYTLSFGRIPYGLDVCHHCDNPKCVNPSHLFVGTAHDNLVDCVSKQRTHPRRGEESGRSRVTTSQVIAIREMRSSGRTWREIANSFGIGESTARAIVSRISWNHVP